ncbi:uncharacterized protein N7506_010813 [Penicillium brevicompactum]|uniref:uncharacterized protein n=1 Tax=Penicillium brevicompactum TaxID=5074 RepID=UPI002540BECD|nr:uncharacterized protein N7506_010813 [Penicillium brevicompactum]KAJ5321683.1 hypothetical protein N7506_010813 [Penicillium brevicompactum]
MGKVSAYRTESSDTNKEDHNTGNYDRRREQVRRAQKKHRDQKDKNCRMLEDELHKLYGLLSAMDEIRGLHQENTILKEIMARYSIPLPHILQSNPALAEVSLVGDSGSNQQILVKVPEYQVESDHSVAQCCNITTGNPQIQGVHDLFDQPIDTLQANHQPKPSYFLGNRRFAQMGVDFVLSLEQPCLFHTQPLGEEEPSGHALSMQGLLLSSAPSVLHDKTSWEIPAQQLEKLFELSGSLGLNGYITPVQAWNRIVSRFSIENLPCDKLDMLRTAMIPHIKCYGFGALMEEEIFESLMGTVLLET